MFVRNSKRQKLLDVICSCLFVGLFVCIYFVLFRNYISHVGVMDDYNAIDCWGNMSLQEVLFAGGYKYRPISSLAIWLVVRLCGYNIYYLGYANIILNAIIAWIIFLMIKKRSYSGAILTALVYICSRFSYYQLSQVQGIMESISLCLAICTIYFLIRYIQTSRNIFFYLSLGLYVLDTLSHERYAVLIAPILFVIFLEFFQKKSKREIFSRKLLPIIGVVIGIIIIFTVMVNDVLMGTGGTSVSETFSLRSFFNSLKTSVLYIVGINSNETYLSGIGYSAYPDFIWIIIACINFSILFIFILSWKEILKTNRNNVIDEIKIAGVYLGTILALLVISSTTIRVEMRWMYCPYIVLFMYIEYLVYTYTSIRINIIKREWYAVMIFGSIILNLFCHQYCGNLYFWRDFEYGNKLVKCVYEYSKDIEQDIYDSKYIIVSDFEFSFPDGYESALGQFDLNKEVELLKVPTLEDGYVIQNWNEYIWIWLNEVGEFQVYYSPIEI